MYVCPFFFSLLILFSITHPSLLPPFAYTLHRTPYSTTGNRAGTAAIHPFLVHGFPEGYYDDDDDAIPVDAPVPVGDGVRRMRVKPGKKARSGAKPKKGAWDNNFF